MDVSKVFALQLERAVVSTNNAAQNALVTSSCRNDEMEVTHAVLQSEVRLGETFEDSFCVCRSA